MTIPQGAVVGNRTNGRKSRLKGRSGGASRLQTARRADRRGRLGERGHTDETQCAGRARLKSLDNSLSAHDQKLTASHRGAPITSA